MADHTKDFCTALLAEAPSHEVAGANDLYQPLLGSWIAEVFDTERDGAKLVSSGEWHFSRVLEGHGVQDVLIVPARHHRVPRGLRKLNRYGSSLRVFDSTNGVWRIHWCNPMDGAMHALAVSSSTHPIVEEGGDRSGRLLRWTFSDIAADAFIARAELFSAGAETPGQWKVAIEIRAQRKTDAAAP